MIEEKMKSNCKKWLLALGSLALLPLSAQAGEWILVQKNCKAWSSANFSPDQSMTWSGPCQNGYATGFGKLIWLRDGKATGAKYEGEMQAGKKSGKGTLTWPGSSQNCGLQICSIKYVGEWRDDRRTCGKLDFTKNNIYDSYDGCFNEWGEMTGPTKSELEARKQACKRLYGGRAVNFESPSLTAGLRTNVKGMIMGVGEDAASAKITESIHPDMIGTVVEKPCYEFY